MMRPGALKARRQQSAEKSSGVEDPFRSKKKLSSTYKRPLSGSRAAFTPVAGPSYKMNPLNITKTNARKHLSSESSTSSEVKSNARKRLSSESSVTSEAPKIGIITDSDSSPEPSPKSPKRSRVSDENVVPSGLARSGTPVKSPVKPSGSRDPRRRQPSVDPPRDCPKIISNQLLRDFFNKCKIDFSDDEKIEIGDDALIISKVMQEQLSSGEFNKDEVLLELKKVLFAKKQEELMRVLKPTTLNGNYGQVLNNIAGPCVMRILLQVPAIQNELMDMVLLELNSLIVYHEKEGDLPWVHQLLQQFRFPKNIRVSEIVIDTLDQLLDTAPGWFQKELISFLPDIVDESKHQHIAEVLMKTVEKYPDRTNVTLDCISNLSLGKNFMEDVRQKMLQKLNQAVDPTNIPSIIRFCLIECTDSNVKQDEEEVIEKPCEQLMNIIRRLNLNPDEYDDAGEFYTAQILVVQALSTQFKVSKDLLNAAVKVMNRTDIEQMHKCSMELVILMLLYNSSKKKSAESILKKHIKQNFYKQNLLEVFYQNFVEVCKMFDQTALTLAVNLLKSPDNGYKEFATIWIQWQFRIYNNLFHKQQEILNKLISLTGTNNQTAKKALKVLCELSMSENDKKCLQKHYYSLRVLLDKMDVFDLQEVLLLHDLLQGLCRHSDLASDSLDQDLTILMRKQLTNSNSIIKSKGVAGCLMLIKHKSINEANSNEVLEKINFILSNTVNCASSRGFFYDKLNDVISNMTISGTSIKKIYDTFEEILFTNYMTDILPGDFDLKFQLNTDDDIRRLGVNLVTQKLGMSSIVLPALLGLFNSAYQQIENSENHIIQMLGYGVFMPKDLDMNTVQTLDSMFYCINWFRELINAFASKDEIQVQTNVRKRLDQVIQLQFELRNSVLYAETKYSPPACYFHINPVPPFNKLEKKIGRKGKKKKKMEHTTVMIDNCDTWEVGSLLSTKNPMYFRKFNPQVLNLLNDKPIPTDDALDESILYGNDGAQIPLGNVCFIMNELLAVFEHEEFVNIDFMQDCVSYLPVICNQLDQIAQELKDNQSKEHKQAFKLIISFLTAFLESKEHTIRANIRITRDALRVFAKRIDKKNAKYVQNVDLVRESYKYFETFINVAKELPLAASLVQLCSVLIQHSRTYYSVNENRDKLSMMALDFLSMDWMSEPLVGHSYLSAVSIILKNWINHAADPLEAVTKMLNELPEQVKDLVRAQDKLRYYPAINKLAFPFLYSNLFNGLIKFIQTSEKIAPGENVNQSTLNRSRNMSMNRTMTKAMSKKNLQLEQWKNITENLTKLLEISKKNTKRIMTIYLRSLPQVLKQFLYHGIPVLNANIRNHLVDVNDILTHLRSHLKQLSAIIIYTSEHKDMTLSRLTPAAKNISEQFICQVKRLLYVHKSSDAIELKFILKRNLDGCLISNADTASTDNNSSEGSLLCDDLLALQQASVEEDADDSLEEVDEIDEEIIDDEVEERGDETEEEENMESDAEDDTSNSY